MKRLENLSSKRTKGSREYPFFQPIVRTLGVTKKGLKKTRDGVKIY